MQRTEPNTGSLVMGGLLIGIWMFWAIFDGTDFSWVVGGLLGAGIAAASYGAKFASAEMRTPIYIGLGLAVGFLIMAIMVRGDVWVMFPGLIAFLLVWLGGYAIIGGLPREIIEVDGS